MDYQNLQFVDREAPQFTVTMSPAESVSGWAVECVVLDTAHAVARTVTVGDGITVTDTDDGVFAVALGDPLSAGTYYYVVTRTSPGLRMLAVGLITVVRTRA